MQIDEAIFEEACSKVGKLSEAEKIAARILIEISEDREKLLEHKGKITE